MKNIIPWAVIAALLVFAAGTCNRLTNAGRELNISEANHRAALDTTRVHLVLDNQGLSRLVEQRSINMRQIANVLKTADDSVAALLVALKDRNVETIAAVQGMRLTLDSLTKENQDLNADLVTRSRSGEVFRVIAIDIEAPGISGDIDISVPADTSQPAEVEFLSLIVHPFDILLAIGCAEHDAVVSIQAPAHIQMSLIPGAVSPTVCNPPAPGLFGDMFRLSPSNVVWGLAGAVAVGLLTR